jgi:superfamily I DNA/RNA helicase
MAFPGGPAEHRGARIRTGDLADPKEEERRVLYVALTRAARYCLVALPDDHRGRTVVAACADLGFVVVGSS